MTSLSNVEFLSVQDEYAALEELHRRGWTDGLPVVVPTIERVEQMLAWSPGLDADIVLGLMGPAAASATVEKIAVNAVMAGCRPEHFPLVLAAVEAVLEPEFNLGPLQQTTHCVTPLVIVNGPVRLDLGVADGAGVLGPGHRTNLSIGRALRLAMLNIGGGKIGVGDMAIFGSPAKLALCVGEAEEVSPFTPYHVSRGWDPGQDTVTVVPVEGPRPVTSLTSAGDVQGSADRLIASLGEGLATVTSNSIYLGQGAVAVLLNPFHAQALANSGLNREGVQEQIWEAASASTEALRRYGPGMLSERDRFGPPRIVHAVPTPADIVVVVCGAPGDYSISMPTWGAPVDLCQPVTKQVRETAFCEV